MTTASTSWSRRWSSAPSRTRPGTGRGEARAGRRRKAPLPRARTGQAPRRARWQDRLERPWGFLAAGCHPNRATDQLLAGAGFWIDSMERDRAAQGAADRATADPRRRPPPVRRQVRLGLRAWRPPHRPAVPSCQGAGPRRRPGASLRLDLTRHRGHLRLRGVGRRGDHEPLALHGKPPAQRHRCALVDGPLQRADRLRRAPRQPLGRLDRRLLHLVRAAPPRLDQAEVERLAAGSGCGPRASSGARGRRPPAWATAGSRRPRG